MWIKLVSRLLLKEAGAPLKELAQNVQFGVGVPHGGLALLTKVRSHLHKNPTHAAAQLDFQNAFGTMHRKACVEQLEKRINPQEPWFLATKNLWSCSVAIPHDLEEDIFQTADGVPQGDPLSTLVFATAMSLLMMDIIRSKAPNVAMVAYVDDTVLLGAAPDVTQAVTEIQTEAATGGLKLQKAKTQVWSPTDTSIENEPLLRTLQGRMGVERGILILGETVSEEPEDALPIGNEAFVTEHIESIKQKLLDDLKKLEHLPSKLVKGEAGLQIAWGLLRRTIPSRFLHVLRGHAVDITAEFCDDIQDAIHRILARWTDQGGLTPGQQRIVELPIEHGGLGFLPVKDLAAIARLSALASLPEMPTRTATGKL